MMYLCVIQVSEAEAEAEALYHSCHHINSSGFHTSCRHHLHPAAVHHDSHSKVDSSPVCIKLLLDSRTCTWMSLQGRCNSFNAKSVNSKTSRSSAKDGLVHCGQSITKGW
ncbi:uncharacterized protein DS421_19g641690 [Arachis hypogaea]|uniref:Uncharacterized protein n=1 Tax=Arachis hypogaea TaxID=3818 RepID=A0A6B9V438_ARAHY|nr:uncharacterized protein DS421_19g641690 [Arachis hypogaea]